MGSSGRDLLRLRNLHLLLSLNDGVVLVPHPVPRHRLELLLAQLRGVKIAAAQLQLVHRYDELVFAETKESPTPDDHVTLA